MSNGKKFSIKEGYQPLAKKGYQPTTNQKTSLPKPPKSGSGESSLKDKK